MRTMLMHPQTVLGLSDGGAHCGILCDASMPTFMLTHWARDRSRGARIPLEQVVRMQTRNTAALFGLDDRGALAPGLRADVNVIDFENLRIAPPEVVFDLPANGRRMVQRASGYRMTIQSGQVIYEDAEPTGALPGRLLRGAQPGVAA
jgi:N-acyl-D-aspartate/D-glutamate deacylase